MNLSKSNKKVTKLHQSFSMDQLYKTSQIKGHCFSWLKLISNSISFILKIWYENWAFENILKVDTINSWNYHYNFLSIMGKYTKLKQRSQCEIKGFWQIGSWNLLIWLQFSSSAQMQLTSQLCTNVKWLDCFRYVPMKSQLGKNIPVIRCTFMSS